MTKKIKIIDLNSYFSYNVKILGDLSWSSFVHKEEQKPFDYLRGFLLYISIIVDLDLYYCPPKNSVCTE